MADLLMVLPQSSAVDSVKNTLLPEDVKMMEEQATAVVGVKPKRKWKKRKVAVCVKCDTSKAIKGKGICGNCYRKHFQPKIKCSNCDGMKPKAGTMKDGEPVCQKCYYKLGLQPEKKCSECGDMKPQHSTTVAGDPVCQKCYDDLDLQPKKQCSNCGDTKPQNGTTVDGEPVCQRCYDDLDLQPKRQCIKCGDMKPQNGTTADGEPVCLKCYVELGLRPKKMCSNCGETTLHVGTTEDGEPLCGPCYRPYPCDHKNCGHSSYSKADTASHARTHGPWQGKSTMEEWMYKALEAAGFSKSWAPLDPDEPPELGTFWYNSRVFSELVGESRGKLECDFMVRISKTEVVWVEPHGLHHYQQRPGGALLATQQEHDRRRREFATTVLPTKPGWSGLTFHEIPCGAEFETFKPRFLDMLGHAVLPSTVSADSAEAKRGPDGDIEEELEQSVPKRQRTTIDHFFQPIVLATSI